MNNTFPKKNSSFCSDDICRNECFFLNIHVSIKSGNYGDYYR